MRPFEFFLAVSASLALVASAQGQVPPTARADAIRFGSATATVEDNGTQVPITTIGNGNAYLGDFEIPTASRDDVPVRPDGQAAITAATKVLPQEPIKAPVDPAAPIDPYVQAQINLQTKIVDLYKHLAAKNMEHKSSKSYRPGSLFDKNQNNFQPDTVYDDKINAIKDATRAANKLKK